eukprot:1520688-Pleurochrysis_carterae.AAC.1
MTSSVICSSRTISISSRSCSIWPIGKGRMASPTSAAAPAARATLRRIGAAASARFATASPKPASTPQACRPLTIIMPSTAIAMGNQGLPRFAAQKAFQRLHVNHLCLRTRLLSLRRQSSGCFHSASCSLIAARA